MYLDGMAEDDVLSNVSLDSKTSSLVKEVFVMEAEMKSARKTDQGWSWMALLGTATCNFLMFGFLKSSGVLYIGLMSTFDVSREEASWPFTICESFFNLFAPLWSVAFFYFKYRTISMICGGMIGVSISLCFFATSLGFFVVCLGVLQGISIAAMVISYPMVINDYFVKKKSIAIGVTMASSGLGGFCIPHAITWLQREYGLQGALLIAGAIASHNVVAAALYRPPPWNIMEGVAPSHVVSIDTGLNSEDTLAKRFLKRIVVIARLLKNPTIINVAFTFSLFELSNQIFPNMMVDYAVNKGIADVLAVWFISSYCMGDLVGGLFWGYWCDANVTSKITLTIAGLGLTAASWVGLTLYINFYLMVVLSWLLGFFLSILLVVCHVFIIDFTDPKIISASFGMTRFVTGLFLLMKSPLFGLFRDKLHNYDYLIYTVSAGTAILMIPWAVQRWRERKPLVPTSH